MKQNGGFYDYYRMIDTSNDEINEIDTIITSLSSQININKRAMINMFIAELFEICKNTIHKFSNRDYKIQLKLIFNFTIYSLIKNHNDQEMELFYRNITTIIKNLNKNNIKYSLNGMEDAYISVTGIHQTPVFDSPTD